MSSSSKPAGITQTPAELETLGSDEPQFLQNAVPYFGLASKTNLPTESSPCTHSSPSRAVNTLAA